MLNHFWPIFMLVLQKRSIHALSERKQKDIFHVKSLVMFTFEMEKFWYIKITQIQRVTNFFCDIFKEGEVVPWRYGRIRRNLLQFWTQR